jgi:hypothetical protein
MRSDERLDLYVEASSKDVVLDGRCAPRPSQAQVHFTSFLLGRRDLGDLAIGLIVLDHAHRLALRKVDRHLDGLLLNADIGLHFHGRRLDVVFHADTGRRDFDIHVGLRHVVLHLVLDHQLRAATVMSTFGAATFSGCHIDRIKADGSGV